MIVVADDLAQALTAKAIFRHKVATHDLMSYSMKDPAKYLAMITVEQLEHGGVMAHGSLMPAAAAEVIATTFFDFVLKHQLADTMQRMESAQIQVIALFVSHLLRKPPKRIHLSERWDLIQPKLKHTPVEDVASPEIPHFARVIGEQDGAAEHNQAALPTVQAPVICQLCGAGFLSCKDLLQHAAKEHHSWSEARKRLLFEVQPRTSVPLRPIEKRRLAVKFMQDMLYSYPGRNTVEPEKVVMRQIVACAICAIKDWIDDFYPCYMWKDAPSPATFG